MLSRATTEIDHERNSRKQPLTDDDARALLAEVSTVLVAKGKKLRRFEAGEAALEDLRGPTGNYRAPMLRIGDRLLVGFHADTLDSLFPV